MRADDRKSPSGKPMHVNLLATYFVINLTSNLFKCDWDNSNAISNFFLIFNLSQFEIPPSSISKYILGGFFSEPINDVIIY